jgi:hypothetical protein
MVGWIRIWEDKNDPHKQKKCEEIAYFRAEGFSCILDLLCGGIGEKIPLFS